MLPAFVNAYICYINIDNPQFLQQCPHDPGRSSGHTDALWKELNLRGCFPILQEMYDIRLIKENAFLAIEIWVAITLLVEVALIAMALAFVTQISRGLQKTMYFDVPRN